MKGFHHMNLVPASHAVISKNFVEGQKKTSMTVHRIEKLNEIGFEWVHPNGRSHKQMNCKETRLEIKG